MEHVCEVFVSRGESGYLIKVRGKFQAGKKRTGDFGFWDAFFAISVGLIAGPKPDVIDAIHLFQAKKDNRVAAFVFSNRIIPEDFHKITRLGIIVGCEIWTKAEFMEKPCRPWSVGIPASPNANPVREALRQQGLPSFRSDIYCSTILELQQGF